MLSHSRQTIDLLMRFWPIGRFFNWLGRQPPFSRIFHPWFNRQNNHAVFIPVNQVIQGTQSVVLPYLLLPPLIEQASQRIILDRCLCRVAENCQTYSHQLGCLFLGQGAAQIHPSMGHSVSVAEASAHIDRAMQAGLVPLIVHTAFDALVLGIPYRRMLAVCFCCDCCCTVRSGLRMGPPAFWEAVERLPGLELVVDETCVGCAACEQVCLTQAIVVHEGRAVVGERCKGCGRCVSVCPVGALQLESANCQDLPHFILERVQKRTVITG